MSNVTSITVARMAGVSQSTVSRVLAGDPSVRQETRRNVLAVVDKLQYQPHPLARGLRGGSTRTIGMLWPTLRAIGGAQVVNQLSSRLERHGYLLYSMEVPGVPDAAERAAREFLSRRVDAVVVRAVDPVVEDLLRVLMPGRRRSIPVLMNTGNKQLLGAFENVDVVCYDYYGAYRQLAAAWWQAGRRRFGYVVPAASNKGKVAVFRAAVESVGGSLPDENIICVPSANYINIPTVVRQALAQDDRVTKLDGVACSCDSIAATVMIFAMKRGCIVPDDLAVAGYDNDPWCECVDPPLASVDRLQQLMVDRLENWLLSVLDGADTDNAEPREPIQEMVYEPLVWRQSAGNPMDAMTEPT